MRPYPKPPTNCNLCLAPLPFPPSPTATTTTFSRADDPEYAAVLAAGGNPDVPRCLNCHALTTKIHALRYAVDLCAARVELERVRREVEVIGEWGVLRRRERVDEWAEVPVECHVAGLERLRVVVVGEVEERARREGVRLDDVFVGGGEREREGDMGRERGEVVRGEGVGFGGLGGARVWRERERVPVPAPARREERVVLPALRPSRVGYGRVGVAGGGFGGVGGAGGGELGGVPRSAWRDFADLVGAPQEGVVRVGTVRSRVVAKGDAAGDVQLEAQEGIVEEVESEEQ
jgi:hypothetical protein